MTLSVVRADDNFGTPQLDTETGSGFGWFDRMFMGFRDGEVFQYDDWKARDLAGMFKRDYRAKQMENVQAQPILSATRTMEAAKGDNGEFEWLQAFWEADPVNGGCESDLDLIVDQMTTAFNYSKAFWEIVWTEGAGDFAGKLVYKKLAWRPQTTCRLLRDPKTADMTGFEQEPNYTLGFTFDAIKNDPYPIKIPRNRSFVYLHGERRDPINGISDMEIAYWAYKTKQKIMFLWFQFLEGVSLPRTVVKSSNGQAQKLATAFAQAKNSGVVPVDTEGNPDAVQIETVDLSGKGHDQFMAAMKWLDGCASGSILAGFLDLTSNAAQGNGPVGVHLSKDAADFFLQTLEAKTREMSLVLRRDLFAPLLRMNFGPAAMVPKYKFEPLNQEDKADALGLLETVMGTSRAAQMIPPEFTGWLAGVVGEYLGGDAKKIEADFAKEAAKIEEQAAKMQTQLATQQSRQLAGVAAVASHATSMVKQRQLAVAQGGGTKNTARG